MEKTPGQAAYDAWMSYIPYPFVPWELTSKSNQDRWNEVADAVIKQCKSIIAEEAVRAAKEISP